MQLLGGGRLGEDGSAAGSSRRAAFTA